MPKHPRLQRLKERKLVQWALAYLAGAWVLYEASDAIGSRWGIPDTIFQGFFLILVLGFFIALIVAWYHGEKGRQRVSGPELLMVAALLVVAGVALSTLGRGGVDSEASEPVSTAVLEDSRPSIAVLPFDDFSPNPDDAYFANGMHEEIITKLSKIAALRVVSRNSVMQYREERRTTPQVALELGVDFVLEGSARVAGHQVRLTAQLIRARTDEHLWSDDYDQELSVENLISTQSDIAQEVAHAIGAVLTPEEIAEAETRPTDNLQAYEYYLRGNAQFARRMSREDSDRAVDLYQRAVEEDPNFALGWAGLSMAESFRQWMFGDRTEIQRRATEAAETSLQLDPDLPEGYLAKGYVHYYGRGDFEAALREFEIAQRHRPNDAEVALMIASVHRRQGRWEEGIEGLERAVQLDPRNAAVLNNTGNAHLRVRQYDDALRYYDRSISVAPDAETPYRVKIQVHLSRGDLQAARETLGEFLARFGSETLFESLRYTDSWARSVFAEELDQVAGELGRPGSRGAAWDYHMVRASAASLRGETQFARVQADSARLLAESRVQESPASAVSHIQLGLTYAILGRNAEAIREGREAVEILPVSSDARSGPPLRVSLAHIFILVGEYETAINELDYLLSIPSVISVPLLRIDPLYDPIRDHPRFQALLERDAGDVGR